MKKFLTLVFAMALAAALPAGAAEQQPAAKPAAKTGAGAAAPGMSEEVTKEMSAFVEAVIQLAAPDVQAGRAFAPYAAVRLKSGETKSMRWGKPNPPPSRPLLAELLRMLREQAKNPDVMMAATVASASVPTVDKKQVINGIRVEVDHRQGEPRVVFIPYTFENDKLVFGTLLYLPGENPVFHYTPPQPPADKPAAAAPAAPAAKAPAKP